MEDFLKLEDEEQPEILDFNREITIEDFLKLEDEEQPKNYGQKSKVKLDNIRYTTGKYMEISPKASINRHP